MEVQFTPEQEAFIRQAIASGRIHRAEGAVQQALFLWEKQERSRIEILTALDEAEADFETGEYTDPSLPLLAVQLKSEARAVREPQTNLSY
jgi:Arc/MetJ-type ribon-helix-helix transcriptional regulator